MTNTPSDAEIDNLLCKHWPAYSMQAVLVKMWLREAIESAIAQWATPQLAPDCHHRPPCDECAAIAGQGGKCPMRIEP